MAWQNFEEKIRTIASSRWNCNAISETIAGVKCDCILKLDADNWVMVEITEENRLAKVRDDIAKLRTVKNALLAREIYCKCYFVMKDTPTDSMRASGAEQNVTVLSADEFQNEYFGYKNYIHIRSQKQFGSLINTETGEPECNTYVEVSYYNKQQGREFTVNEIINLLKNGKRVILKGDFGLGKSRCIKQIFDLLTSDTMNNPYTIAINLRDHWGARRGIEILTRHFEELGLDARNFLKTYEQPGKVYLLDGFDEIGTQSWSSDIQKMQHVRQVSVCALKDLITNVQGGILIAGREYYFNSDREMLNCLGLDEKQTVILECHNEFTDAELLTFISENISDTTEKERPRQLPAWLPKRPLVIQLLLKYASDIFSLDYALEDICGFWDAFLMKICEREARIYPSLNPEIIKNVLVLLANKTRYSSSDAGPITQGDLSDAFMKAAGFRPSDESAIMLQRLPSLGRVSADSPDRQFLDSFILNALRAEGIIQSAKSWDLSTVADAWRNPLDSTGCYLLAQYIEKDEKLFSTFLSMARRAADGSNKILAADIISSMSLLDVSSLDFKDLYVSEGHFSHLSFEGKEIKKLTICDSIIDKLDLTNSKLDDSLVIERCIITTVLGIASRKSIPPQLRECDVENFEPLATTALIKKAKLSDSQKIFVEMIRKIFFQPGAGRKEAALLRGMGATANKQLGEKILNKLLDEKVVTRHKGDEGYIYKPVRNQTERMDKILTDLTLSQDSLWVKISGF